MTTEISPDYFARLKQIESGGNPNAANPTSGASGPYQFMPKTAAQYGLSDPTDPAQADIAVRRLTTDNARTLSSNLGRVPSAAELYLAHQQGASGATRLLSNPAARAVDIAGRNAILNNGGSIDMTAGDFANLWARKWDGVGGIEVAQNGPITGDLLSQFNTDKGAPGSSAAGAPASGGALQQQFQADSLTAAPSGPRGGVVGAMAASTAPMSPIDDPSKLPNLGAQAIGSLPTDPQAKADYLASKLFPNLSRDQALSRLGYQGGRLYYVDDSGNAYFAEPQAFPAQLDPNGGVTLTGSIAKGLRELPNYIASKIGPSLPTIGGMARGLLTPEAAGGVPGAAAGGAIGQLARQGLAQTFTDQKSPGLYQSALDAGGAALEQGGGQLLGRLATFAGTRPLERNPLRVGGYDASTLTPARIAQMESDAAAAQGLGVTVTPGEAGNVRSLLNNQRQLFRQPESSTPLNDFYFNRNTQQLPAAMNRTMGQISPVTAPGIGARDLARGAQDTIDSAVAARSRATKPFYRAAAGDQVSASDIDGVIANIDAEIAKGGSDKVLGQLHALRNDLIAQEASPAVAPMLSQPGGIGKPFVPGTPGSPAIPEMPVTNVGALDSIRKYWRDRVALPDVAPEATPKEVAARINPILSQLRGVMENASPAFAQGRAIHAAMTPAVSDLESGLTGLAAADKASGLQNVPKTMFGADSADPIAITSARNAFVKAGKVNEWNAGLRSFLDNAFQAAQKMAQGPANSLYKTLMADPRQAGNLKAAMSPTQWSAFNDFMKVLEMVRRAPAEGSPTATDLVSRSSFAGPIAKGISKVVGGLNPMELPDKVAHWITNISAGKNAADLVGIITNPGAVSKLRQLRIMSPGSKKWTSAIVDLAAMAGVGAATSSAPMDQTPPYLEVAPAGSGASLP
jgi:hypothetical protein